MYDRIWTAVQPSVASITMLRGTERLSSGSGFKVGSRLVTNNHVVHVPAATHVAVRFVGPDGTTVEAEQTFTLQEFQGRLLEGADEQSWDFAIYDLDIEVFASRPSLTLGDSAALNIGGPIALLGFQFEQQNLSIHTGVLSSRFRKANVRYLQLDASVNHGNSGGPLIDPESGAVVGVVTRKATGLTEQFDQLITSFEQNIQAVSGPAGSVRIGGVDPIETFRITQRQLGRLALEIRRSANVGIGYAYSLDMVSEALKRCA